MDLDPEQFLEQLCLLCVLTDFGTSALVGRCLGLRFSQYLVPVVFAEAPWWHVEFQGAFGSRELPSASKHGTQESSWRIPADAWLFLAPSIIYGPLTRRRFPNVCNFPLDFEMMVQPPAT